MTVQTSSTASEQIIPVWSTPRPMFVTVVRRSTSRTVVPSTSAISKRVELVPMSITATRNASVSLTPRSPAGILATSVLLRDSHSSQRALNPNNLCAAFLAGTAPVDIRGSIPAEGRGQPKLARLAVAEEGRVRPGVGVVRSGRRAVIHADADLAERPGEQHRPMRRAVHPRVDGRFRGAQRGGSPEQILADSPGPGAGHVAGVRGARRRGSITLVGEEVLAGHRVGVGLRGCVQERVLPHRPDVIPGALVVDQT